MGGDWAKPGPGSRIIGEWVAEVGHHCVVGRLIEQLRKRHPVEVLLETLCRPAEQVQNTPPDTAILLDVDGYFRPFDLAVEPDSATMRSRRRSSVG